MSALASILPSNVAVIEEAVTTTNTAFERLGALKNTDGYFGHRGWALGWGLGVSIGVKLAWPDRPVLALLGEGASLYGIQGLWSAARYRIPVVFVICNNAQYQILKIGARGLKLPQAKAGKFKGMDLTEPEIDLVSIARGLGVEARRIAEPDELCDAVQAAWKANDRPILIDVPISRAPQSRLNYG
jgi:benzoylformate decarboxylase